MGVVTHGSSHLKVAADNQHIHTVPTLFLARPFHGRVDGIQGSVALSKSVSGNGDSEMGDYTSFDGDTHVSSPETRGRHGRVDSVVVVERVLQ